MNNSVIAKDNELPDLWRALKTGDEHAFQQLYQKFMPELYSYGKKFSQDTLLVEDAVQDLFCTLWLRRSNLGTPASVKNYLLKAFRTTLYKKFSKKNPAVGAEPELPFNLEFIIAADEALIAKEQLEAVKKEIARALAALTGKQKEIIYYRFYLNLEFSEIARIMDLQVRATYKLAARALLALRAGISPATLLLLALWGIL